MTTHSIHSPHPDTHSHGLHDGCPRCEEHAEDPVSTLDAGIDAETRIRQHQLGHAKCGKLPAAAIAAGVELQVAAIAPGSRWYERWLKNRGGAARVCPLCTGRALPIPAGQAAGSRVT